MLPSATQPPDAPGEAEKREQILQQIDIILASIVESMRHHSPLEVQLKNRFSPDKTTKLSFPGQTSTQCWRFAAFVKLLEIVHTCLTERKLITKRDIYYQNVNLFRQQVVVDRLIDDLAATFCVKRSALNVVAAAKGLVCGRLTIHLANGQKIDCDPETGETLIPLAVNVQNVAITDPAQQILVVEKEAVFRSLLTEASEKFKREFIMVTGKGYPDVSTREFLALLSHSTGVQIYALMDYDPDGLQIASIYHNGSASLGHEGPSIVCTRMNHVGVTADDMKDIILARAGQGGLEGLICLSSRDRKKAQALLEKRHGGDSWQGMQFMLFLGYKGEIEILAGAEGSLEAWLYRKLEDT